MKWSATEVTFGSTLPHQPMSSQSTYETLNVTCEDGLRVITYNRPDKKNAISEKMFEEVVAALKEAADDPKTLITATTGAGNVYTAGNDLKNFRGMATTEIADLLIRYFSAFIDFPKPLVAVINGAAVGAGVTLLPMYDAVFATQRAIFFTPFSSLGIVAEGCSTYTFPMVMGHSKATELLLFDKKVSAAEACKLGLVTEVYPDATFQEEVWPRVRAMTKLPPKSLLYSKQLCREIHRAKLHEVNIAESKRVAERLVAKLCPDSEEYKKFASSLPPLPANVKI
ncbi:enoyl-CoA delta isomerase 2-like isoform X2 [Palaemon carinicauda]